MKKSAEKGVKQLQLKKRTICRLEASKLPDIEKIKGGDEDALYSLVRDCPITKPGKP